MLSVTIKAWHTDLTKAEKTERKLQLFNKHLSGYFADGIIWI